MNYMFEAGFLGTRAPFFMDFVTLIVALLPFLMLYIITLARKKHYKAHSLAQVGLFLVSVIVLTYFEMGVRMGGGFLNFMKGSSVSHDYAFMVLVFHIIISIATLFIWGYTLLRVKTHLKNETHKSYGKRTFVGVVLTALSGIWVYLLLFVY